MRAVLSISTVAAWALLGSPAPARAQSATVQAQSLFDQGRALLEKGQIAEACAAFEASQKLEPVVTTLLNLAACREQNDQLATAWGYFVEANRMATAAGNSKLAGVATRHATRLKPTLSQLKVEVGEPRAPGLELRRGKEKVAAAAWGFALPVDGGTYTFTARASGYRTWTTTLTLKPAADNQTLRVPALTKLREGEADVPQVAKSPAPARPGKPAPAEPGKKPAEPAGKKPVPAEPTQPAVKPAQPDDATAADATAVAVTAPSSPAARRSLVLPLSFGAGALALGGAALGFHLWGDVAFDKAEAATLQSVRDDWRDTANTRRYLAIGAASLSVAAAGTAIYFYVRGGRSSSESPAATALHLTATPELAGLIVRGGW